MYRIIKTDGTELGTTDFVNYIRIGENGCFVPTSREKATGVAFCSTPYNLIGHNEIKDAETVLVTAVDGGQEFGNLYELLNIILGVTE